jgi:hypothetical protein
MLAQAAAKMLFSDDCFGRFCPLRGRHLKDRF